MLGETSPWVKVVVADARAVLLHESRTEETLRKAAAQMAAFAKEYAGHPWVDIMARAFPLAVTYLQSPYLPRTNGRAERVIKEIRRRIKTQDHGWVQESTWRHELHGSLRSLVQLASGPSSHYRTPL